ncbi:MAG: hypothetical protein K8963_00825, partial [Proteobacteria bacterium]|nr:hypothetical protein [Pseudomonadota bacterium]
EGNINRPDRPNTDTTWIQVSASATYSCGINRISFGNSFGNSILCWGSNARNLLGAGFATDDNNPRRIDSSAGVAWQQLSAGSMHTCAVDAGEDARPGGRLHCWGIGAGHRLGMGTDVTNRFGPSFRNSRVGSDTTWIQVSAGGAHSCATNVAGELHCWGSNSSGQTGQGGTPSSSPTMMPAQVGMATNWAQVSAGEAHTCALNTDDELYCWGESDNGRLGLGTVSADGASPAEVAAPTGTSWAQASTGSEHTCAITMANTLYCWGEGDNGRLGLGAEDTADKTTPTQIGSDTDWVMVSAGGAHTCAIKTVDQLYCWGKADSGQLGLGDTDGTNTQSNTPARVTPA